MSAITQVWPAEFAARYRDRGYWDGETLPGILRERAMAHPGHIAVIGGDERWTYGELDERAATAAAGFLALGLRPGDPVVLQVGNRPEFLSALFGLYYAGLIPVYALPAHRLAEVAHLACKSGARGYVIADRDAGFDYRTLARDLCDQVPDMRHVAVIGDAEEFASFNDFEDDPDALPEDDPSPSSVAHVQASGGSTGLPKLIPRTHDDYIYSFRESANICRLNADSVYMVTLPAAHNFPMSSPGFLGTLYASGTVVMCPSPDAETAFSLIERERVTITGLVPSLALLWAKAARNTRHDLSSLRVLQVGGAKLTPEGARRILSTMDCTLQQVFGMAEGLVNYTRLDDPEEVMIGTQGRPISPDDELLIVDDDDRPVPDGKAGHLLTRGPYTIRAYHDEPEANARSFTADGHYRTGDIVERTPEGNLVLHGRASDHISRAGEKISAEEVENHLLAHPQVLDAAVVSIPDEFLGERICAFIIPNGTAPKSTEIKAWMRRRNIAAFKVPDEVRIVDHFHTTAVGKTSRKDLRAALRRAYLDGDLGQTGKGGENAGAAAGTAAGGRPA